METAGNQPRQAPAGRGIKVAAAIFFLIITLSCAFAAPLSITLPTNVNEGDIINAAVNGPGQLSISINNAIVATGSGTVTHTLATTSASAGMYTYSFSSDDPSTTNETRTLIVQNIPLEITTTTPTLTQFTTAQITVGLTTNLAGASCSASVDGSASALTPTSPTTHSATLTIADGVHTLKYECSLGAEVTSVEKTIIVDTSAPQVTSAGPSGEQVGPYITLSVETDEIAQCRYGETDQPYANLPNGMSGAYVVKNAVLLTLTEERAYTYFVRCSDVNGNVMTTAHIISFVNKIAPSAHLAFKEKTEPLKAGTYELSIKTNVALPSAPSLTATFQNSGGVQSIGLSGEDTDWKGFLTIPEQSSDAVVSFTFEGKNAQGVVGRTLSGDTVVTMDALAPGSIDGLSITNTSNSLQLSWRLTTDEEDITYRIYRADHEGVSTADFLTSTKSTQYHDTSTDGARYYFYRVAALDSAGNLGPLSDEIYGSAIDETLEQETPLADPLLLARLNDEIDTLRASQVTANKTITTLQEESNPTKASIIRDMHLIDDANTALQELTEATAALTELTQRSPSVDEVDAAIAQAREQRSDAYRLLITRLQPEQQTEITQPSDAKGLERALPYAILGQELDNAAQDRFLANAVDLQDHITVTLRASSFSLWSADGAERKYTFVAKELVLDNPVNDLTVIESIPKEVAQNVDELTFSTEPTVLEQDPVVQYTFSVAEREEYSYILNRLVPMDALKQSRTFAYPRAPPAVAAPPADTLTTGYVTLPTSLKPSTNTVLLLIGGLIIAGLIIYYVSLTKSEQPFRGFIDEKPKPAPPVQQPVRSRIVERRSTPRRVTAPIAKAAAQATTSEHIREQLTATEAAINRKAYEEARALYDKVAQDLRADSGLKEIMHDDLARVEKKLLLFERLSDVSTAIAHQDVASARAALQEVRTLAGQIGEEETTLMAEAKGAYTDFVRALNKIEIEKTAHY